MLHALLLSLSLMSSPSFADAAFPVFTCPKDANGDRLTVTLVTSPGPLGGYFYDIAPALGERPMSGKLAKAWRDPTYPVELSGLDIQIAVPTVELHDIPVTQVRVGYRIKYEKPVSVICRKGPEFASLFRR